MTDKNPLAHYSGVLSEAVQESAAADQQLAKEQIPICIATVVQEGPAKWNVAFEWKDGAFCIPGEYKLYTAPTQAAPAAVAVPDERAAFEKWASFVGHSIERWRNDRELYDANVTDEAWIVWQARAALAATPAAWAKPVSELLGHISDVLPDNAFDKIDTKKWNAVSALVGAATPAADAPEWDGKLPAGLQRALNELRTDCKTDAVNSLEFEVRSVFEGMHTSLATVKRMYHGAQKRLELIDAAQPDPFAAAAQVVLPEPDVVVSEVMELVKDWSTRNWIAAEASLDTLSEESSEKQHQEEKRLTGEAETAYRAIETKLRALLAGVSAPAAQAVPAFCHVASLKLKSLQERGYQITGYALEKPVEGAQPERGFINHGGFVGWWWDGQSPQAQADARDADGEAFRTAARLGLTLRFYGNCAQSGTPGTSSAYEVIHGQDSAAAMREAIQRADAAIAQAAQQGGE